MVADMLTQVALGNIDIVPARYSVPTDVAGLCLQHIRANPKITRTELQKRLGLSQPTTHRLVSRLREKGIVEFGTPAQSCKDTTETGRPSVALKVAGSSRYAVGAHIGLRETQLVLTDLAGRTVARDVFALSLATTAPDNALPYVLQRIGQLVHKEHASAHVRSIGLAFSTDVTNDGVLESPLTKWDGLFLPDAIKKAIADPVVFSAVESFLPHLQLSVGSGVSAMAGMELAFRDPAASTAQFPSILYVYSREVLRYSWIINGGVYHPGARHQTSLVSSLTANSSFMEVPGASLNNLLGDLTGDPLSVARLLNIAADYGYPCRSLKDIVGKAKNDPFLAGLLDERAELLAEVIGIAARVMDPDEIVLAGETFVADSTRTRRIARRLACEGNRILKLHPARGNVTIDAAKMVALNPLWRNPLSA